MPVACAWITPSNRSDHAPMSPSSLLVIGYGNPGRGDDGLGPAFVEAITQEQRSGLRLLSDYQLAVEHASDVAAAAGVLFVDAMLPGHDAVCLQPIAADTGASVSSHTLTPAAVLALATTLYDATPPAWLLGIPGERFGDVEEGLSDTAMQNLSDARSRFDDWYRQEHARLLT